MTLNDLLTRQNIITKLDISALSKELRIKVMRIRMDYNKIKKQFDEDVKEFTEQAATEELRTLANKTDRTEAENTRYEELNNAFTAEYLEFLKQKGEGEVSVSNDNFTSDEFDEVVGAMDDKEVEINGNKIPSADFLEVFADIFVVND